MAEIATSTGFTWTEMQKCPRWPLHPTPIKGSKVNECQNLKLVCCRCLTVLWNCVSSLFLFLFLFCFCLFVCLFVCLFFVCVCGFVLFCFVLSLLPQRATFIYSRAEGTTKRTTKRKESNKYTHHIISYTKIYKIHIQTCTYPIHANIMLHTGRFTEILFQQMLNPSKLFPKLRKILFFKEIFFFTWYFNSYI